MFDNLVESGSHAEDVKRKGSFLLVTTAIYLVLGMAFFVAGIMWYNAQLDMQNLELTALIAPVPAPPAAKQEEAPKPEKVNINQNVDVRKQLIADVSRADIVPEKVSNKASDIPPVRKGVATVIGTGNTNAIAPVAPGAGTGTGPVGPAVVMAEAQPPPPPKPTPHAPISGGVLNGKAIRLVTPAYPAIARSAHASGAVQVQVLIDENGNVISAHAVSGHPLLQAAAVGAARASKFSPTKLSGQPVKVNGVIIYNFVAQ
jgi:periplasmic protein TonB